MNANIVVHNTKKAQMALVYLYVLPLNFIILQQKLKLILIYFYQRCDSCLPNCLLCSNASVCKQCQVGFLLN